MIGITGTDGLESVMLLFATLLTVVWVDTDGVEKYPIEPD